MKMNKKDSRIRRAKRGRLHMRESWKQFDSAFIDPSSYLCSNYFWKWCRVLASASTQDKQLREKAEIYGNVEAAKLVGTWLQNVLLKKA